MSSFSDKWRRFGRKEVTVYLLSVGLALCVLYKGRIVPATMTIGQIRLNPSSDPIRKFAALEDENVLNLHIVPHTHDDVGWLKTVEQYYYGLNNSIQRAGVHDILDTVVEALMNHSARTFVYVEMKYFSMWWKEQTEEVKAKMRLLVANRQFQFANGGWCMHDEAATHFMGMLDQTTLGHQFLLRELGYIPRVGWQLDPFGHSATQASLFTAKVGFDALYFGRIDFLDRYFRLANQECEGVWHTNLNDTVFWGLTGSYNGNYGEYPGFCFDVNCWDQPLLDKNQTGFDHAISEFLGDAKAQSDRTKGNNIMLTFGSDFRYENASRNFANMDALIAAVTQYQDWGKVNVTQMFGPRFNRVNIFYSTPEYYTEMKHNETQKWHRQSAELKDTNHTPSWSVKSDDFFPYSDCNNCFWTGYFTSRTTLKRLERVSSSFLLAARQIETIPNATGPHEECCLESSDESKIDGCPCGQRPLYELEDALGVAQHHDAVSGTSKQHVAFDYAKRLDRGIRRAEKMLVRTLKRVVLQPSDAVTYLEDLTYCQLLNETICEVSQNATQVKGEKDVYVIVYNSLATPQSSEIMLPVSINADFDIIRLDQPKGDSAFGPIKRVSSIPRTETRLKGSAPFALAIQTGLLPPVGAAIFKISTSAVHDEVLPPVTDEVVSASRHRLLMDPVLVNDAPSTLDISNGLFTVKFDRVTGMMTQVSSNGVVSDFSQQWGYYESFDASIDGNSSEGKQNSGAYIFRPSRANATMRVVPTSSDGKAMFYNLTNGVEVHVQLSAPWIKQIVRVLPGVPYIEVDYTVGPIPTDDGRGKEVIVRYMTSIQNNGEFYTDSNGREFLKRKRDFRPTWNLNVYEPVAGNFYPVNAAIYLQDKDASLAVLVDRSQGGASIVDGSVELMVQRRTLQDDGRGVNEALNETVGGVTPYPPFGDRSRVGEGVTINGRHRIMFGKGPMGAKMARSQMDSAFAHPLVFVASSPAKTVVPFKATNFSLIQTALPENIMLITLTLLHDAPATTFLIRLGHQYDWNEDEKLSQPVQVNLATLLAGYEVLSVTEKTLTGNQNYTSWLSKRLQWTSDGGSENYSSVIKNEGTEVELKPMDIKTFEVRVK